MLLKLEMNLADDAGNPIKTCSILKCHKQEGDQISHGDPLFDIEVAEILIPSRGVAAWKEAKYLLKLPSEIADLVAKQMSARDTARNKSTLPDTPFAAHVKSHKQIIALERGIVRKVYTQAGDFRQI